MCEDKEKCVRKVELLCICGGTKPAAPFGRGGYSTTVSAPVCGTGHEGSIPSSHPKKISSPLVGGGIFLLVCY